MPIAVTASLLKKLPHLGSNPSHVDWSQASETFLGDSISEITIISSTIEKNLIILEHQQQKCVEAIAVLEEAGGLSVRARNFSSSDPDGTKYADKINECQNWFQMTLSKLDVLVRGASYPDSEHPVNLLMGGTLSTFLDAKKKTVINTEGMVLTAESLGIRPPNFSSSFTIQNARIDVMNAIDMVVTLRNIISFHINQMTSCLEVIGYTLSLAKAQIESHPNSDLMEETRALKALQDLGSKLTGDEAMADEVQSNLLKNFASQYSEEWKD
jgi:hypothetical protein